MGMPRAESEFGGAVPPTDSGPADHIWTRSRTSSAVCHLTITYAGNMDSRNTFSKGFKKLKHKLTGGNRKQGGRYGSENDQGVREADVGESEASQKNSRLHSEIEDAVESGPSREENDADAKEVGLVGPPASTPSIPHSGEYSST
jgi:hypothetical protein